MELIHLLYIIVSGIYFLLILWLIIGTYRLPKTENLTAEENHQFSIIIPFRNEEKHLPELLDSIKQLEYSRYNFEILFVDDDSSDKSVNIIENSLEKSKIDFQILVNERHSKSPKKDAIQTAISKSKFKWIITTDADCILPKLWLKSFNSLLSKSNSKLIAAPVELIHNNSFVQKFQMLEVLGLQTATSGSFGWNLPFLTNGANLYFEKETFLKLSGYEGNNHIASGDDIFLLEKFISNNIQIEFLNSQNATVKTHPELNWKDVINQRIRWASKTKNYQLKRGKVIGSIVFLMNLCIIVGIPMTAFNSIESMVLLSIFGIKFFVDFLSMIVQVKEKNKSTLFSAYLISSLIYPFLSVWIVVKSLTNNYQWKGRTHKT